ncbi:MAG: hypothetical protein HY899_18275 [Deltaproteobacteria bacterium]|nr:hypothetical protein [Deltaproteobacteria bacterium]
MTQFHFSLACRAATLLCAAATLMMPSPALAQNHPFASHPISYAAASIAPSHLSQAQLDQAVTDFYDAWKQRYLTEACGAGRYVVLSSTRAGNLTVSEAHGYGMILTALMAGHDPQARQIFDGMVTYAREHPTTLHDHLMAWYQNKSCADADGADSASDGDLDIAFALLLADKQWGSCGAIDYHAEALQVLADIAGGTLDATHAIVLLGDWVAPGDATYADATRTSDFMPDHYRSFFDAGANPLWNTLRTSTYQIVDDMQTNFSPVTGLLPDFVVDALSTPAPAPAFFLEADTDGAYSYNACRDPWRLATDYLMSDDAAAHAAVAKINAWIRASTGDDPSAIGAGYQLSGAVTPGTDYLSMAFVAPLGVGAMVDAANQSWLNGVWDLVASTPIDAEGYYENTLKALAMITMSRNWWAPEKVSGGCVSSGNSVCTDGGYITDLSATISGTTKGPGRQGLKLKGNVFFPGGIPVPSLTQGAQLLVEDMGSGASAIYQLTAATDPIPAEPVADCDARDGWKTTAAGVSYTNRSGALDVPACTPGSAAGLRRLRYRNGTGYDFAFDVQVKKWTIASPVGPLRVSLVLGDSAAAGSAGQCAISAEVACSAAGNSVRCR